MELRKKRIGVAIITCNRKDFLITLLDSINKCKDSIDELVIINDGDVLDINPNFGKLVNNPTNLGVCKSKNYGMRYLLDRECDYIFVIEDDMKILREDIFQAYVAACKETGIQHMMFAYHGPANKGNISGGRPMPRKIIDYGKLKVSLNVNCVGSFCFYTKKSLEEVGLFDEEFDKNNFEHVEHSYRLAKAGYSTPYWWWADLSNSLEYITEQACSEVNSAIRRGNDWFEKIKWSALLFKKKHGYLPAWNDPVPDTPLSEVLNFLKRVKQ